MQESQLNHPVKEKFFTTGLENIVWVFTVLLLSSGIASQILFACSNGILSSSEFAQISSTLLILISWLYFKPDSTSQDVEPSLSAARLNDSLQSIPCKGKLYLPATQARMAELKQHHMISQEYTLPFPYLSQIYHLLNLKHLENVHSFSLSNLKILQVSDFQTTCRGGIIKFQTALDSPVNTLRIWRKSIAEAALILHTPYMVELAIPVYNDKKIIVLFNAVPLNKREHQLFIDIYSNLAFPKPLLQILLHIASCLTIFEDMPYLKTLSERNLERLVSSDKISNHETMSLFRRYTELYGQGI